ncbi:MAG: hypothetical protein IKQ64_01565 [Bacteroidales bacterium]|nr:hypothetical protein [Bacteroidales bacterium]
MKYFNIFFLAIVLLSAEGCHEIVGGIHHLEAFRDRYVGSHRDGYVKPPALSSSDTSVFITAVEFPPGYDWRRDSSFGEVSGRIVLYRDSVRILEVPAGPGCLACMDADLHHLIGGHLYTESCTSAETVIARDGERLFSYPGRELLCGMLVEGRDVYTLGRSRSGEGFSLRRNGEELFSRPSGGIAVLFSARPDYPTGALYREGGHMYFSFWEPAEGIEGKEWYVVEDGVPSRVEVPDGRMYDIRIRDGGPDISPVKSTPLGVYTYAEDYWKTVVVVSKVGRVTVLTPRSPAWEVYPQLVLFLSFRNACVIGKRLYVAMNPKEGDGRPYLNRDGKALFKLDLNGFITEVSAITEP